MNRILVLAGGRSTKAVAESIVQLEADADKWWLSSSSTFVPTVVAPSQ